MDGFGIPVMANEVVAVAQRMRILWSAWLAKAGKIDSKIAVAPISNNDPTTC